ncbi:glycoside hydrolase family 6 protein [Nocardioides yefusunii]|uniref:Glucanase n=1 Tax=Nocardioides yefusunii TaxID=2500546 RepID=A0ABW1QVH6_9ACTN|nr:glycoside hydrolase family 6 protein [Nocardioides yefusunii]
MSPHPALSWILVTALGVVIGLLGPVAPARAGVPEASPRMVAAATKSGKDVRLTRPFHVDPSSQAARSAGRDRRLNRLAATPQARWFTDRTAPVNQTTALTRSYVLAAKRSRRTPVLTLYAIPGRDCGLWSAGGYESTTYKRWIRAVAKGLKGTRPMVVLEPDAVASLGDCAGQGDRAALLRYAAKKLTAAGAWVYLDAGHSGWHTPAEAARRLKLAGVKHARGFVTNVSNHRATASERAFGRAVRAQLKKRGIPGKRFVIDTSRNGVGPDAANTWCNNTSAKVGPRPRVINGRKGLDAYLWIKRPGESDGWCNGGPEAGQWWEWAALNLMR